MKTSNVVDSSNDANTSNVVDSSNEILRLNANKKF